MSKAMLIFNPMADRGRTARKAAGLRALAYRMGDVDWADTEHVGHATELAEQAGNHGYDTVVAVGGDGTVHEVVNGLMRLPKDERSVLGVVPIGTGNDFAHASGINRNPQVAMERVFTGSPKPIDVSSIADGKGRTAYWDNSAGMLIVAAVSIQSQRIIRLYGFMLYLIAAIRAIIKNYDAAHVRMTMDGITTEHDLILLTLGNGPREGGGFQTNPEARNDDGRLNYCISTPISRPMMVRLLPVIMQGKHGRFDFITMGRFRSLKLEADRAVPIHLDGELWASYEADVRELTVEIIPHALQVIC